MSSTNSTSGDNWWDVIAVFESDYVPDTFTAGGSVEANHELLAGLRENDFDTSDSSYTYGLMTLAIVFLVAGLLACILLPCCYMCLGTSRQERLADRLDLGPKSHYKGNLLMVIASVAAIATAAGAVWGLEKTDSGLTSIEDHTQSVATDLKAVLSLPNDTSTVLDRVSTTYDALLEGIGSCSNAVFLSSILDQLIDVESFTDEVQAELEALNSDSLNDLASDVQGVSDAVADTEGVRKGVVWPAIALAMFLTAVFIFIGISTYECIACGFTNCGAVSCFLSPCTVFLAVLLWLSAASAVTLSALSGDFCTDPDSNVGTLISDNSDSSQLTELLIYYTGDCSTSNEAIDVVLAAQEVAIPVIQEALPILYELADACDDVVSAVESIDASFEDLWVILQDAGELSSCENLNGLYQAAVYDELCTELPKGLLGFWVSCVILTVLLLILAIQWNRMLGQQTTEADVQAVEESARRRGQWLTSGWSKRNLNSSDRPAAAGMAAASSHSSNSRHSSSSSRHAPISGSRSGQTRGQVQPTRGLSAVSSNRQGGVGSSSRGNSRAVPVQRPVEIANPHRTMRG